MYRFRLPFIPGPADCADQSTPPDVAQRQGQATAGPHSLTVKLFEDNAKEAGLVGVPVTIASVVREKFAWNEIAPAVTTFVIAALLFWQGLDNRPLLAAVLWLWSCGGFDAGERGCGLLVRTW
jgi:hypothetical protein